MAFGGKVYYAIYIALLNQGEHLIKVTNVGTDKSVIAAPFHIFEVGKVACVGKLVNIYNVVVGIFVHKQAHHVRADKSSTAGDNDIAFKRIHNCD